MYSKLIAIIKKISEYQEPNRKVLQKLIYLIERRVDLGLNFSMDYYGPYSSVLDDLVYGMQIQGFIEIAPDGVTHRIYLTELSDMVEHETFTQADQQKIESVLKAFGSMTAFDLELITTTDFVARELCKGGNSCTDVHIIEGVKKMKGDKFSDEKISQAISLLREY